MNIFELTAHELAQEDADMDRGSITPADALKRVDDGVLLAWYAKETADGDWLSSANVLGEAIDYQDKGFSRQLILASLADQTEAGRLVYQALRDWCAYWLASRAKEIQNSFAEPRPVVEYADDEFDGSKFGPEWARSLFTTLSVKR